MASRTKQQATASAIDDTKLDIVFDRVPDKCPRCHTHQQPKLLSWQYMPGENLVEGVFRCVNAACEKVFIAEYHREPTLGMHILGHLSPYAVKPPTIARAVVVVSPMFVEILTQVETAREFRLDQLEGVGLRKALEFLIKDYATLLQPDKDAEIRKEYLGKVIEEYIEDNTVKQLAARATWLGNDETHYERRWETKDLNDLRALVRLTVNAIENKIEGDKHIKDMPDKGRHDSS
jgi:hypothetical protein